MRNTQIVRNSGAEAKVDTAAGAPTPATSPSLPAIPRDIKGWNKGRPFFISFLGIEIRQGSTQSLPKFLLYPTQDTQRPRPPVKMKNDKISTGQM